MEMKKLVMVVFAALSMLFLADIASFAQAGGETDKYINLLRKDLRSDKKQLIAANMNLTEAEAVKFWPVYDQYAIEGMKIYDARIALVKEYAANYDKLTDAEAKSLNKRSIDIDESMTKLRQKYVPIVAKVLPGKKSALFFQIDKRLALLIDLQTASEIPMVEL
ncbi:MAG: hypothetical protein H7070_10960 [Saprospiraceae bacterium]|nr:hypothetical protein [Pyrinomonadaceae bacterium]